VRVVLASVGTRGDIQPMVALAQALRGRGHDPLVACPETFAPFVGRFGIAHAALGEDMQALVATGKNAPERSLKGMTRYFREQLALQAPRLLELATGADAIVSTAMAWTGPSVAEKLGIAALALMPSTAVLPTPQHPPPLMPWVGMPGWVNRALHWASDGMQNRLMGAPLDEARAVIGLPPVKSFLQHLFVDTKAVLAADESFLPPDPSWGDRYPYAGFLFVDDPTPLDPSLDAWLRDGEPPVYVGFGSMAGAEPERVGALLGEAMERTKRRCLVGAGAAGLFASGGIPDRFHVVREAPHAKLFPRVAAIVHHGGAGTTASALRAGVPQVILPMMLDQFHHAHYAAAAGLAPKAPSMAKITAKRLARAIDAALCLPPAPRRAMAERLEHSDAGGVITTLLEQLARTARSGVSPR
jgi:UDP:flavonoid glycosyltransferase YjiC (YdhE family)